MPPRLDRCESCDLLTPRRMEKDGLWQCRVCFKRLPPLPTLAKALPGYKCLHPPCVQALHAVDAMTVACPLQHTFPLEGTA